MKWLFIDYIIIDVIKRVEKKIQKVRLCLIRSCSLGTRIELTYQFLIGKVRYYSIIESSLE